MSKPKLFVVGGTLPKTPHPVRDERWHARIGFEHTDNPADADVVLALRLADVRPEHVSSGKRVVTWTNEPKWDFTTDPVVTDHHGVEAYVFNVYCRNVYTDNFFYAPLRRYREPMTEAGFDASRLDQARVAVFSTLRRVPLFIHGVDVALDAYRSQLALDLHERGRGDIRGRNWPEGVAIEDTREGNWSASKLAGLEPYAFNLCCENTLWDYYITEKLWHAIEAGCMPIYLPPATLDQVFPSDSFIDLRTVRDADHLLDIIDNMSPAEYVARSNACIEVFNRVSAAGSREAAQVRVRESLAEVLLAGI